MAKKTITIEIEDYKDLKSKFKLKSNMRKYEIIGILTLALEGIKDECINNHKYNENEE